MERRKFTREFKLEAVRLIKERGVSFAPQRISEARNGIVGPE
jgi:transposase-like protein